MSRSMTKTACGRPAPRYGLTGGLFVKRTSAVTVKLGIGTGRGHAWRC